MSEYLCRMPDRDGDDWTAVQAFAADDAATSYAELVDGQDFEAFQSPGRDDCIVEVQEGGEIKEFTVSFDYSKVFSAHAR